MLPDAAQQITDPEDIFDDTQKVHPIDRCGRAPFQPSHRMLPIRE
jgi:hypothetical protein